MSALGARVGLLSPPNRSGSGRVIYVDDFRGIKPGMWNDGVGDVFIDDDISYDGAPSCRLSLNGEQNAGATSPGRTAATSGIVLKRRLHDGYRGRFGMEFWFRMSSLNLTSNTLFSASIYNRNGTDAHHFRVWLD